MLFSVEASLYQCGCFLRVQVTGQSLREVVREVGARLTPQEAGVLVQAQLRDRDQKDADQWQVSGNNKQQSPRQQDLTGLAIHKMSQPPTMIRWFMVLNNTFVHDECQPRLGADGVSPSLPERLLLSVQIKTSALLSSMHMYLIVL